MENGNDFHGAIFSSGNYLVSNGGYFLRMYDASVGLGISQPYSEFYSSTNISYQNWYFITATYNNSSVNIYINATLDTSTLIGNGYLDQSTVKPDLTIGTEENTHFWKGKIDDIRIYNRVLNSVQIDALYHEGGWTGTTQELIAYYPFNGNADDESRNSLLTLDNLQLMSPLGIPVYISNILDVEEKRGPISVERKNGERMVKLNISVSRALGDVLRDVSNVVSSVEIPEGITINYAGQAEEQQESFMSLILAILLGIILVYLVMSAQFESFIDPFIIMFSITGRDLSTELLASV